MISVDCSLSVTTASSITVLKIEFSFPLFIQKLVDLA